MESDITEAITFLSTPSLTFKGSFFFLLYCFQQLYRMSNKQSFIVHCLRRENISNESAKRYAIENLADIMPINTMHSLNIVEVNFAYRDDVVYDSLSSDSRIRCYGRWIFFQMISQNTPFSYWDAYWSLRLKAKTYASLSSIGDFCLKVWYNVWENKSYNNEDCEDI